MVLYTYRWRLIYPSKRHNDQYQVIKLVCFLFNFFKWFGLRNQKRKTACIHYKLIRGSWTTHSQQTMLWTDMCGWMLNLMGEGRVEYRIRHAISISSVAVLMSSTKNAHFFFFLSRRSTFYNAEHNQASLLVVVWCRTPIMFLFSLVWKHET